MQKTIVFCANEDHAERMRIALNNLNADMVKQNPDYVVRITGSDAYGKSKLDYFISVSSPYPVNCDYIKTTLYWCRLQDGQAHCPRSDDWLYD